MKVSPAGSFKIIHKTEAQNKLLTQTKDIKIIAMREESGCFTWEVILVWEDSPNILY